MADSDDVGETFESWWGHTGHLLEQTGRLVSVDQETARKIFEAGRNSRPERQEASPETVAQRGLDALNSALLTDPGAMYALITNRIPCTQALADDPFLVVSKLPTGTPDEFFAIGMGGVLAGLFDAMGLPKIATEWSDDTDELGRKRLVGFRFCGADVLTGSAQLSIGAVVKEIVTLPEDVAGVVHPEQIPMAGGKALSSKIPNFHLVPTIALEALANRFNLGCRRKAEKAWNAVSKNQEVLLDRDFLMERLGHVIHHCIKLRDKVADGSSLEGDDDAGAIIWGGAYAVCATRALIGQAAEQDVVKKE